MITRSCLFAAVLSSVIHWINAAREDALVSDWLRTVNDELARLSANVARARWSYETNINPQTSRDLLDADAAYDNYSRSVVPALMTFNRQLIEDPLLHRQMEEMQLYAINGTIWTEAAEARERLLVNTMTTIFNTKSICSLQNGHLSCPEKWLLDPHVLYQFSSLRDYDLLGYVWKEWRDVIGPSIRPYFLEDVTLLNLKARAMNFSNWGAVWRSLYETPNFENEARRLFYEVLPLYEQLHAYVRRRLARDVYQNRFQGHTIPAHILGNLMAEEWSNIYQITMPYPDKGDFDVAKRMGQLGFDGRKLFQLADDFYTSMGMIPAPESFWRESIFSRIPGRSMVCHPSSWDMFRKGEVRVRMCAKISQYDLVTAHHEMGHIQYFLQYADQPFIFRQPPNPGFHEAIGDTIALAASTRRHMRSIGLLQENESDESAETDINWLYKQALFKIPFVIFSYLVDFWRWRVFDGAYVSENLNKSWWDLYFQFMGIIPPVTRNETDFDPAAKSHIIDGTEFARYFIAGIIQFQFYQSLCQAAGHIGPLHQCDFYKNKEAGTRFASLLKLGSSAHCTVAMRQLTGDAKMSAEPLLTYFEPLYDWLKRENSRNEECYGWGQIWPEDVMNTLSQPRC